VKGEGEVARGQDGGPVPKGRGRAEGWVTGRKGKGRSAGDWGRNGVVVGRDGQQDLNEQRSKRKGKDDVLEGIEGCREVQREVRKFMRKKINRERVKMRMSKTVRERGGVERE
jgi:hypothetical protein